MEPKKLILRNLNKLKSSKLIAGSTGLVFNQVDAHCLPGADRELALRHRLPILARIPRDDRAAAGAGAGRPVHLSRSLGRQVRELARTVHPQAAPVEGTWP